MQQTHFLLYGTYWNFFFFFPNTFGPNCLNPWKTDPQVQKAEFIEKSVEQTTTKDGEACESCQARGYFAAVLTLESGPS